MKNTYKSIFIYSYTFFILASLNVNPNNFILESGESSIKILNIFRFFFPTLMLIIFIFFKKKWLFKNLHSDNSFISKLSVLFFLILLFFSMANNFYKLENLYFILYFNIFANLYILTNYFKAEILIKNFFFILLIYFCYWFLNILTDILALNKLSSIFNLLLNLRNAETHILNYTYFLDNSSLNSNGAARILSIIFLILLSYQLFFKKKLWIYLSLFLLFFLIYCLQSKFSYYTLILTSLLIIFINKKDKLKEFLIVLVIFIFPILVGPFLQSNFFESNKKNAINNNRFIEPNRLLDPITKSSDKNISDSINFENTSNFDKFGFSRNITSNLISLNKITTGRVEIWINYIAFKNQTNYFFGLGILADKVIFSTSSSNALIYSYFSTGILGSFCYLIICFIFFKNFIKYFFYNNNYDMRLIFHIIGFFLIIRTIIENGFLNYGLDLFLILICFEAINRDKLNFYKPQLFRIRK
jgi:hypothetical protein